MTWPGSTLASSAPTHLLTTHADRAGGIARVGLASIFIFVFMQGWVAPLTGWSLDPSNSALMRNGFIPAYLAVLVLFLLTIRTSLGAVLRSPVLYLIILLCGVSALWSIDGEATLRRTIALFFTTLAGTLVAASWRWKQICELLAAQFAALMLLSFVVCLAFPQYGVMSDLFPGAWRGLWLEKNALGGMMSLGMIVCTAAAVLAPERRLLWLGSVSLSILLVLLSTSKTSLLGIALGVAAVGSVWLMRRGPVMAVLATWAIVTLTAAMAAVLIFAPELVLDLLGKNATLTGRTEIWTAAIRQGQQHAYGGFGYGVLWDHKRAFDPALWIAHDAGFAAGHAHNGWLETWLGLGFVGLAAFAVSYAVALGRVVFSAYSNIGAYLAVPYFLVFTLRSITEVSILDYNDPEWLIFVVIVTRLGLDAFQTIQSDARRLPSQAAGTVAAMPR